MNRFSLTATILCSFVLTSFPGAATAKIANVESLEWMTVDSELVIAGKVVKVEKATGENKQEYELVTVAVSKTFKGEHAERITFFLRDGRLNPKGWMADGTPLLLFLARKDRFTTVPPGKFDWVLRQSNHGRNSAIFLGPTKLPEIPTMPACTREFDILTKPHAIFERVEKTIAAAPKDRKPKSESLEVPGESAVYKKFYSGSSVCLVVPAANPPAPPKNTGAWSRTSNSLQARIALVERPKFNGTRKVVPYLELRNVSDSAAPVTVPLSGHVKFELVGENGKVIRDGRTMERSGHHPAPGAIVLPFDSSIRIGMHCTNWGVPKDAPAMIATDSGAWVLQRQEKAKVFLRVTLKREKVESESVRVWHGNIEALVRVDWKE